MGFLKGVSRLWAVDSPFTAKGLPGALVSAAQSSGVPCESWFAFSWLSRAKPSLTSPCGFLSMMGKLPEPGSQPLLLGQLGG